VNNLQEIPHAQGPEKSVLSSILCDELMRAKAAADGIGEDHFHIPAHRHLFRLIRDRSAKGLSVDLVSLFEELHRTGELEPIGGIVGVSEIATYAPNSHHFESHAQILRESLARRTAFLAARKLLDEAPNMDGDELAKALSSALEGTVKALNATSGVVTAKDAVKRLREQLAALADQDANVPGLSTGLYPVDLVTGGIWPVELWVVAAETSGGKSVIMLQAALSALKEGKRVFIVSLEMDAPTIAGRMIANLKSIPNDVWRKPKMASPAVLNRATSGMIELEGMPLTIDDQGGRTVDQIAALAQAEVDRHGKLDLIVVDYIQRVAARHVNGRSREQEVAEISSKLKGLAMKLKVPVITASQLNDGGKLRESRAIGQDADVVLVVEDDGIRGLKVRNGERDQLFPLALNGEFQRFETIRR
jgi:replicative DNA helicase